MPAEQASFTSLTPSEQNAVVTLCVLAAFADGAVSELEREEIRKIAQNFSNANQDLTLAYQKALAGTLPIPELAAQLASPNSKALAYEMAVCICSVDQALSNNEQAFLAELRTALHLEPAGAAQFERSASLLRDQPPVIAELTALKNGDELDRMIRETAILAGALEIMPQRLSTMAIVPIQMRMVYKIGKTCGYDLDLSHTREFLATAGLGLTSQVVDSYLSKIVGNVTRRFVGRFAGALISQATESAISFASTYALGQVAKTYYQGGRTLSTAQLRDLFSRMLNDGRSMQTRYSNEIAARASSLKIADFLPLTGSPSKTLSP